ncbi:hypothetical protein BV210_09975 [Halorientalis sp. IM1011]|uniref:outer membrane protein assembly factor BamB family protein n=1 Tax=Halorientalis sp. IM1011 TaxID=1932360 RepID=UPI00097CD3DB|nr:PQQ-binding-like beta-propeller repeat protein [Halorientalis sp. IM1011]AQL43024.1 hypothetical protein BV210_09975 [Halorientalis sp. IM1011]
MCPPTRRAVLGAVPAIAAGLAGCSLSDDDEPPVPAAWTTDIASPLPGVQFGDGPLLIGSAYYSDREPLVAGLDPATGETQWSVERLHEDERGSPVSGADGVAYTFSTTGTVRALDAASGDYRWRVSISGLPEPDPGVAAFAPMPVDDLILVPVSGREDDVADRIVALDADDGGQRWSYPLAASLSGRPDVTDGAVVLPQTDGVVEAVDLSGDRRWSISKPTPYTGVTAENGVAYVGNVAERIEALDVESGERRWQSPTDNAVTTPPVLDGADGSGSGTVYVGAGDHYVYAVDAASGTRRWRTETRAAVTSGPAHTGDALVAIAGGPFEERARGQHVPLGVSPSLHVLGADDGSRRERFITEGYQSEGDLWWVAAVGDHVYVGQERQLLRLDGGVLDA